VFITHEEPITVCCNAYWSGLTFTSYEYINLQRWAVIGVTILWTLAVISTVKFNVQELEIYAWRDNFVPRSVATRSDNVSSLHLAELPWCVHAICSLWGINQTFMRNSRTFACYRYVSLTLNPLFLFRDCWIIVCSKTDWCQYRYPFCISLQNKNVSRREQCEVFFVCRTVHTSTEPVQR